MPIFRNFPRWLNRVFSFFFFFPGRLCGCLFAQFRLRRTPRWTVSFFYVRTQYVVHGYLPFTVIKRKCSYLPAIINQSNEPWSRPTTFSRYFAYRRSIFLQQPLSYVRINQNEFVLSYSMIQEAFRFCVITRTIVRDEIDKKLIERVNILTRLSFTRYI